MAITRIFKTSLKLPKKQALFSLNRETMRDTMVYLLLLMTLVCLPDTIRITYDFFSQEEVASPDLFITQLIVLLPFIITFLMVAGVTSLAGIAYGIRTLTKRKLAFQQLWKMTGYALTLPILIITIFRILQWSHWLLWIIPFILLYTLIYNMITIFPKRKTAI
ncbi:phosphatidylglycerophosphate synthase [Alkalibacillus flavidus]|uniref:Phosphatidylglycerophosphate synthase n=1 Tax=Alkalibacillus flavidus TaxID=546021 RepID=A0ABV2L0C9_9BACI